ncbi:hypothetical protein ACO3VM_02795 [Methanocaldococcus sp. 10A]
MVKLYTFTIKALGRVSLDEEHTIRVDEVLRLVKIQRKNIFDVIIAFKNQEKLKIPGELADTEKIYSDLVKLMGEL